jgi:hypothetical protein
MLLGVSRNERANLLEENVKLYRFIRTKNPLPKRYVIQQPVKPPKKIPLKFFKNIHPPPRSVYAFGDETA